MINRNFTLLWIGKFISQLGDKFYAIALAWWILQETGSASIMGFFMFVSVFPCIALGFFAGALVDRWKRKNILIVTDIIRGGLVLVISLLAIDRSLEVWHVFAIAFCLSAATAFFDPAAQSILPEIVEKDNLQRANGINQTVGGICTVAGPLFGAVAVGVFGMETVFAINSISYFVSALLSCFILIRKEYRDFSTRADVWSDLKEGIRFLKNRRSITTILKIIAAAHFFLGSLMVSLPFLAKSLTGDGIKNLGYLEMMLGVGMIAGAVLLGSKKKTTAAGKRLVLFMLAVGICFGTISVLQFLAIRSVIAYMFVLVAIGTGVAFASVTWQSLLQRYTPAHMTGRVFSISSLVGNVSLPVAYGTFGILLNLASIRLAMAGCCICLLVLCFLLLPRAGRWPGGCLRTAAPDVHMDSRL